MFRTSGVCGFPSRKLACYRRSCDRSHILLAHVTHVKHSGSNLEKSWLEATILSLELGGLDSFREPHGVAGREGERPGLTDWEGFARGRQLPPRRTGLDPRARSLPQMCRAPRRSGVAASCDCVQSRVRSCHPGIGVTMRDQRGSTRAEQRCTLGACIGVRGRLLTPSRRRPTRRQRLLTGGSKP